MILADIHFWLQHARLNYEILAETLHPKTR